MTEVWMVRAESDGRWAYGPGRPLAPETAPRGECTLDDLGARLPGSAVMLLDGRAVTTLRADIPGRSDRQARIAAPFAVEEEIAEDIEGVRVVCGSRESDGARVVAVVHEGLLTAILTPLAAVGRAPFSVIPEYLALPWQTGQCSLHIATDRVLVRINRNEGFACDLEIAAVVVPRTLAAREVRTLDVYGKALPFPLEGVDVSHHPLPEATWDVLSRGLAAPPALELLPQEFRQRAKDMGHPLLATAAVLVLALVGFTGFSISARTELQQDLATLEAREHALMAASFPGIERIVNAEVQATQVLGELRAAAGGEISFLELLHGLGTGIAAKNQTIEFTSIAYADGILSAQVVAPDIAVLEALRTDTAPTLNLEIVSVEARDNGVVGSLRASAGLK
jgi:general secretion pathway protein L